MDGARSIERMCCALRVHIDKVFAAASLCCCSLSCAGRMTTLVVEQRQSPHSRYFVSRRNNPETLVESTFNHHVRSSCHKQRETLAVAWRTTALSAACAVCVGRVAWVASRPTFGPGILDGLFHAETNQRLTRDGRSAAILSTLAVVL